MYRRFSGDLFGRPGIIVLSCEVIRKQPLSFAGFRRTITTPNQLATCAIHQGAHKPAYHTKPGAKQDGSVKEEANDDAGNDTYDGAPTGQRIVVFGLVGFLLVV